MPILASLASSRRAAAAATLGLHLQMLEASTDTHLETAFASLAQLRVGGLVIGGEPFFNSRSKQIGALSIRHAVPMIYQLPDFTTAGGLASYGADLPEAYHMAGLYSGRILSGERPGDLPVQQATKIELIINLKTAKTLGITVPLPLLGRADDVIE